MAKDDIDVFGVDDVCDLKDAKATPLFSNFAFEDWALLSLRFELHLLVHAVRQDAPSPDKQGMQPESVASYYNKYFEKSLSPENYGVRSVEDIIKLVQDTAMTGVRTNTVESMISDSVESNDIFIKLTEEHR